MEPFRVLRRRCTMEGFRHGGVELVEIDTSKELMSPEAVTGYRPAHGTMVWLASTVRGDLQFDCSNLALGMEREPTIASAKELNKNVKRAKFSGSRRIIFPRETVKRKKMRSI